MLTDFAAFPVDVLLPVPSRRGSAQIRTPNLQGEGVRAWLAWMPCMTPFLIGVFLDLGRFVFGAESPVVISGGEKEGRGRL